MTLYDTLAVKQVIGGLMHDTTLLLKYSDIVPQDFENNVARICFGAIHNLYKAGATKLSVVEVENEVLKIEGEGAATYRVNGGVEFLKVCFELAETSNFKLYHDRLKKCSLLRCLKKGHYDISDYFKEDKEINNPREEIELQERFDEATLEDILNNVEGKYNEIRNNFMQDIKMSTNPAKGIFQLIDDLKKHPDNGPLLEGDIFSYVTRGARSGCLFLKSAASSAGKALPNSTVIPTPVGFKTVGEIKQGDYLFDAFGKPTKVLGVFPQGEKEVWEVEFKDGRKAKCCEEHLWSYCTVGQRLSSKQNRKFYTSTLKELSNKKLQGNCLDYKILVPVNYAVEYSEKILYPSPYAMGALLGDGSFRYSLNQKALSFSSQDEELVQYVADELNAGYRKNSSHNYSWTFRKHQKSDHSADRQNLWVEEILVNYPELWQTKSEDKFIPSDYLFGSIEQRIDLLNGLLDTDGTIDEKVNNIKFFTISEKLRDNVIDLCHSLGLKTTVYEDTHKETHVCYVVAITGRPEDKVKLFRLKRKKDIITNWYNNGKRKESNEFNPIVSINKCNYSEEMTCFYVDNPEHLFLMNDYIVTHNTRTSVFDACRLAYPIRYSADKGTFIREVTSEWKPVKPRKVLFIVTEMDVQEIQTIILAYLSGVNEEHILRNKYEIGEEERVMFAATIMKKYQDYFIVEEISEPNLTNIQSTIKKYATIDKVKFIFYDYLHSTASLIGQFAKSGLREDVVLMLMANQLKQLAKDYKVFIFTATQVNATGLEDDGEFKDATSIRGAKSINDKCDCSYVMTKITNKMWNAMVGSLRVGAREGLIDYNCLDSVDYRPTHILDVYKNRRGRLKDIRIWTRLDLGTGERKDLFITNAANMAIPIPDDTLFQTHTEMIDNWRDKIEKGELMNDN